MPTNQSRQKFPTHLTGSSEKCDCPTCHARARLSTDFPSNYSNSPGKFHCNVLNKYCPFQKHETSAQVSGYYEVRFSPPPIIIMARADEPRKPKQTKWIEIYSSEKQTSW